MNNSIKIIIVGASGVGKTSLAKNFVSGQFVSDYRPSIGTNLFTIKVTLDSGKDVMVQLWDIAGQERWIQMRHIYYKGTQGTLIVADLTRKNTFEQIEKFWYPDLVENNIESTIILLANKDDLEKQVTDEYVNGLVQKIEAKHILYTSAKTGNNVINALKLISEETLHL